MRACMCLLYCFYRMERTNPLVSCSAHSRYSIHILVSHEGRNKGGGERERGDGKEWGGRVRGREEGMEGEKVFEGSVGRLPKSR